MTTTKARIFFVDFEGPSETAQQIVAALGQIGNVNGDGKPSADQTPAAISLPPPVADKPAKNKGGRPRKLLQESSPSSLSVADIDDIAFKVGVYLKDNGKARSDGIKRAFGIDDVQFEAVVARPWFERNGGCWTLSADGHAHFQRDDD